MHILLYTCVMCLLCSIQSRHSRSVMAYGFLSWAKKRKKREVKIRIFCPAHNGMPCNYWFQKRREQNCTIPPSLTGRPQCLFTASVGTWVQRTGGRNDLPIIFACYPVVRLLPGARVFVVADAHSVSYQQEDIVYFFLPPSYLPSWTPLMHLQPLQQQSQHASYKFVHGYQKKERISH